MQKYFLVVVLIFFSACKKSAPRQSEEFRFEDHYSITHELQENDILSVKVDLKDGLHAYGSGEKIGKSIDLKIKPDGGWTALGRPHFPEAKIKNLSGLGESNIIENDFELRQKLSHGRGPGKALFYLQVCTDNACDRPRIHEIIFNGIINDHN